MKYRKVKNQLSSVTQSCPTLCDPMGHSTPGLPIRHQLPEFTQAHVHWLDDAMQPSQPLLCPSPPAFNLSQHQGLFKWVSSSHQVARVLDISPSSERSGLISFRMDQLDLLAVQGISILSSCNSRKRASGHGMKEKLKYSWPSKVVGLGAIDPLHGQN